MNAMYPYPPFKSGNTKYYILNSAYDSETRNRDMFIFSPDIDLFADNSSKNSTFSISSNDGYILGLKNIFIAQKDFLDKLKNSKTTIENYVASPINFGKYQHYENKDYAAIAVGLNLESNIEMVVYRELYEHKDESDSSKDRPFGSWWVRPRSMFLENVNIPESNYSGPRFTFVEKFK